MGASKAACDDAHAQEHRKMENTEICQKEKPSQGEQEKRRKGQEENNTSCTTQPTRPPSRITHADTLRHFGVLREQNREREREKVRRVNPLPVPEKRSRTAKRCTEQSKENKETSLFSVVFHCQSQQRALRTEGATTTHAHLLHPRLLWTRPRPRLPTRLLWCALLLVPRVERLPTLGLCCWRRPLFRCLRCCCCIFCALLWFL